MKTVTIFLLVSSLAGAQEIPDPADGMGKAGVGLPGGSASFLRNPALPTIDHEDFVLFTGEWALRGFAGGNLSAQGGLLSSADSLSDLFLGLDFEAIQSRLNSATPRATAEDFQNTMTLVNTMLQLGSGSQGVTASVGGGFHLQLGSIGVYARQVGVAGISPLLDLSNTSALTGSDLSTLFGNSTGGTLTAAGSSLADQLKAAGLVGDSDADGFDDAEELAFHAQEALGDEAISDPAFVQAMESIAAATNANAGTGSSSSTLFFNGSGIEMRGISIQEIGFSASYPLLPGFLSVGATVKQLVGETFRTEIPLDQLEEGNALLDELLESVGQNGKKTTRMSIDLGVTVRPLDFLTIGLVGRNLLPAEFEYSGTSDSFTLAPQFRLGVGITTFGILNIAFDIDLLETELDVLINGQPQRYFGGGVEIDLGGDLFGFKIRAGGSTDLAAADMAPLWSLGLDLKFLGFFLNVNGQMATSTVSVESASTVNGTESVSIPEQLSGSLTLGFEVSF